MSYGELNPEPSCVGLWHFNGDANDSSGNGHHGTVYGATLINTGRFGQCYLFNGISNYITVPDSDAFTTNAGTILTWIYLVGWGENNYGRIIQHVSFVPANGIELYVDGENTCLIGSIRGNDVQNEDVVSNVGSIALGVWYFVGLTWDGSYIRAYINGIGTTKAQTVNLGNANCLFVIGKRSYSDARYFDGKIEEMGFYNRAWSAEEIRQKYAEMQGAYGIIEG